MSTPATRAAPAASTEGLLGKPPLSAPFSGILSMIGCTPMLALSKLDTGPGARLFGKMELMNPAGSIKDRIGLSMIEAAEKDGRLNPHAAQRPTIIEATAGNTGLGLALVGRQRGYNIKFVMPDKMSQEKIQHLRAMGAEVILTRSDVEKGHPEYYQDLAKTVAELAGSSTKKVLLSGYHDTTGDPAHNAELAKQRAKSVRAALVAKGVALEQVLLRKPEVTAGGGSDQEARRVEIRVIDAH